MADTADTADTMANTANILARYRREADATSAEADGNSAAANRENTATGAAETGEDVIGAAIGGVAVTGAAAADSSSAEVIRTTGIGTHIGAGAILTRTTAIILRIGTLTTVAPYQDSDSLGPDPSWFPAPGWSWGCVATVDREG
jgi:ABC-type enterochelin transport system substrate-binding protein